MREDDVPRDEAPEDHPLGNPGRMAADIWGGYAERQRQRRLKLRNQSWGEFFRGLALQFALILAGVVILFALVWLVRG
jgi:hypothetical protein